MGIITAPTVIVDNGSANIKSGFSGEHFPQSILPIVDHYCDGTGKLDPSSPNTDWDAMENIWERILKKDLNIKPRESFILLTESPGNTAGKREKMAQIMFERFEFPKVFIANKAILSLHHSGRTSGIVVQCGHGMTQVVPVYQSLALPGSTVGIDMAGHHLTNALGMTLSESGHQFKPDVEYDNWQFVKEKLCYVARNFDEEMQNENILERKRTQRLPDGQFVTIDQERFRSPEMFFRPSSPGIDGVTLQKLTNEAILATDPKLQNLLFANIVACGGTTLLPGFCERLELEMRKLTPGGKVRVSVPDNRELASWIGGSELTSVPSFQNLWVTREEYQERGAGVIHSV